MPAPDHLSLRRYGAAAISHSHDHFQMLVGLSGVLDFEVEGRGQRIAPGDAVLVAPGERHDCEALSVSECLVLDTGTALWAQCQRTPAQPQQLAPLASYLALALQRQQPLAALHGPTLLLEAWRPFAPKHRPRRSIDWPGLQAWVQARLDAPLTVADLAQHTCLSPSQFALRCHEATGLGAMQWLRQQRLAQARLLRGSGLAVAEVARRTGYRSPSALTAALRRGR